MRYKNIIVTSECQTCVQTTYVVLANLHEVLWSKELQTILDVYTLLWALCRHCVGWPSCM